MTRGSTYRVTSMESRESTLTTEGTFQGVTSMGSVDALVLEVDGDTRLVPTHMVVTVDVLEAASGEAFADDEDDVHYM